MVTFMGIVPDNAGQRIRKSVAFLVMLVHILLQPCEAFNYVMETPGGPRSVREGDADGFETGELGQDELFVKNNDFLPPVIASLGYKYQTCSRGDIYLERGQTLKIKCSLNESRLNTSEIFFTTDLEEVVPDEYLTRVNASTAVLVIPNMNPTRRSMYFCNRFDTEIEVQRICQDTVVVGLKPQEVKNLRCIFKFWETTLSCEWNTVDHYLPTSYRISWFLESRFGFKLGPFPCPTDSDVKKNKCIWPRNGAPPAPPYRMFNDRFFLAIEGSNALGNVTFEPIEF